ncbi:sigma-70 family RNA polymerase sigma factor [Bradyrhizobium stylosanthis]|uniref:sigma-70 family RNA polymerase sigma factor n=1 Tax=Bradyrhizobium stylosanthis TaxID=1803665 RepID=UPI0009EE2600|nr:sigma-70 family RNA polymerase sigma factor [Bradyrhizobium stylosanthis]
MIEIEELAQSAASPADIVTAEEAASSFFRTDLVERVLKALLADAERAEGDLQRADINRAYLRRKLTIPECEWVEQHLRQSPIRIVEDDEGDEDASDTEPNEFISSKRVRYLTEIEERELGRKIQLARQVRESDESSDPGFVGRVLRDAETAKSRFVETNIRYVYKLARQERHVHHLAADDLFQEGMMGLLHATELYDPELGFRFKTYATWWVQQRMHRARDDSERTIRLPVHVQETIRRVRRKKVKLALELNREPSLGELADYIGANRERLAKLLWRLRATDCLEADAPVTEDGDPLINFKSDDEAETAFEIVAQQELRANLSAALATLSPRAERILRMRFGLDGNEEQTLESIGQVFHVTRERIRQIEAKALRTLKHPSRSRRLRSFIE